MKKIFSVMVTICLIIMLGVGCGINNGKVENSQNNNEKGEKKLEIALIVKATDSGFWQKVINGGKAYGKENDNVNVTVYGTASESDIEKSIGILEDVVSSKPDAIVIATNAGEGAVPSVDKARKGGIPVITIDTKIPTEVDSHLATDNVLGGALAAEAMVEHLNKNNKPLEGTIAIVAAVAGVDTIIERDSGFCDKLKELAPNIKVLEPRYVENDISKALATAEDLITTYDDLIGIYADNNHTGDGVAKAIEQANLKDKITVIAFDDDEDEIKALKANIIKALIIQDQYNMGHSGCEHAVKAINGEKLPKFVDTGVKVTKPEDIK